LIALPSAIVLGTGTPVSGWAGVVVRLLGNVLLGAAVLTPPSLRLGRAQARLLVLGLVGSALAAALVGRALDDRLPPPVDPSVQLGSATSALPAGHPVVLGAHALAVLIYAVAAVSFARQSARTGDELFRWVATGYVLAAFAAVHYLLFPSLYSAYVYT